jgi:steroid 5-alpha reductase family enzyme
VGAEAVVFGTIFSGTIAGWPLAQLGLVLAYAVMLGGFLAIRARGAGYRKESDQSLAQGLRVRMPARVGIWVGVSVLYVLLFVPVLVTLSAQARGASGWSVPLGCAVMLAGLLLEATADWQKSRFKSRHHDRICDVALFRMVRCPNYLGELVFWFGVWLSAIASYHTVLPWIASTLGYCYLVGVMVGATRRLEAKQAREYGSDPGYRAYAATVPVLLPLIPLYSLRAKGSPPA